MNTIEINNQNVLVKQYKGLRVVTFKDIDTVHGRADGTARRNFNSNKIHFIEGEDFFKIQPNEIRTVGIKSPNGGIVVTESGYLMLVKSFTDDLSWDVQRQLVKSYFRAKEKTCEAKQLEMYDYFDKTYNGEPVLTSADVEYITGIRISTIDWFLRTKLVKGQDYYYITGADLVNFKKENPKVSKLASVMNLITKSGFEAICKAYGIKIETPKVFIEEKKVEKCAFKTILPSTKEKMSAIRKEAEHLIHLTYLLDVMPGTMLPSDVYQHYESAITRQIKSINMVSNNSKIVNFK